MSFLSISCNHVVLFASITYLFLLQYFPQIGFVYFLTLFHL